MRDLEARVLQAAVVSDLTGVSPRTLARWEAFGIPPRRPAGAGYSWADVEVLQRTAHLVRTRRLPLAEAKKLVARARSRAGAGARLVVARPTPKAHRRRVVPVSLPRSAKRRGGV